MRFLFSGLMAALAATTVACKGDPTAEGAGTPVALRSDFAAVNVVIGTTGAFTSWATDVRLSRLEAPVSFTTCNAAIATVAVDTAYHPVPATSMRAVVTSVLPGTTCVRVASPGLPGDSVGINVVRATPLVITTPNITSGLLGAALTDTARVVGGFGTLDGTITVTLYDSTQKACAASPRFTYVVTIPGTGVYPTSPGFVTDKVGIWTWKVAYSGNTYNKPVSTLCTTSAAPTPVTIKAATTLTTTANPLIAVNGDSLRDAATLGGGAGTPGGTIIFRLYDPTKPACPAAPTFADTVSVSGTGTPYNSRKFKSNAAGIWRWTAEYSGDAINAPKKTACDDEQVTVS